MNTRRSGRRRQQRGFVLMIVVFLMLLLVGLAASVLLSTKADLQVAGNDREAAVAFYAAEAGVANAKDYLFGRNVGTGAGAWNNVLRSAVPQLCVFGAGTAPGTAPAVADPVVSYDATRGASYQFCVHDNGTDPNYPAAAGDTTDGDGVITIESWGFGPNNARAHLTVDIGAWTPPTVGNRDYFQAGGDSRKNGAGEDITNAANTNQVGF